METVRFQVARERSSMKTNWDKYGNMEFIAAFMEQSAWNY